MENALRFAKKFYFWPVCLIALGLALFFWSSSIGALDKEFTSNESNYLQSKSSVDNIPANPPNEKMVQAVEGRKNVLMQNVYNAWEALYNQQNENNTWPEIVINERTIDFNGDLSGNDKEPYREQYLYRIVEEFRKMIATLNLVPDRDKNGASIDDDVVRVASGDASAADQDGAASPADGQDPAVARRELVVWSGSDIDSLIETHFSWKRIPTPLQIRVAQEDFWIFKNIIDAIKTLNEGVDNRSAAALREIRSLLITNDAVEKFQERLEKGFFDEKSFSKTSGEDGEGAEGSDSASPEASAGGEGGEALKKEFRERYDMRYVDQNGRGLTAEQFNALNNVEVAGINTSKIRRVPVYMSLVIKQNRLSDLMAALTNAEKPVDIKLVVINPGQGWTPSFNFSQFENENPEGEEGAVHEPTPRGRSGKSGRRGSSGSERARSNAADLKLSSDEILVDIYGVINLFNAPSMDIFPGLSDNLNGDDSDGGNSDNPEEGDDQDVSSDAAANDDSE